MILFWSTFHIGASSPILDIDVYFRKEINLRLKQYLETKNVLLFIFLSTQKSTASLKVWL